MIKVGIHYLSYQLFLSEVVYQREKYNTLLYFPMEFKELLESTHRISVSLL